jgi:dTDP-4-amino-4,6-dideoxygalactose transaminase
MPFGGALLVVARKEQMKVPFNRPYVAGDELEFIRQAVENRKLSGNGEFTKLCQQWLLNNVGGSKALLTGSCTTALEMCALLEGVGPSDEVIMPSYTFVSTANAFVLRGAVPVFTDIREDTLNIDEKKIEAAITEKTKAIAVVHYAGIGCEMDAILRIAGKHGLSVVEDAAQGLMSTYRGKPLGTFGRTSAFSFHETKNIVSGEGGALIVNDPALAERAEILWEKGTNRCRFYRGEVDKYTWVDVGSSFLPSELTAAFLHAQLLHARDITDKRIRTWNHYHELMQPLEEAGKIRRPVVPEECEHNAHLYYLLLPDVEKRDAVIGRLKARGIHTVFHYVPLHSSPAGKKFCRAGGDLSVTESLADRLVRLPLWAGLEEDVESVAEEVASAIEECFN